MAADRFKTKDKQRYRQTGSEERYAKKLDVQFHTKFCFARWLYQISSAAGSSFYPNLICDKNISNAIRIFKIESNEELKLSKNAYLAHVQLETIVAMDFILV